MILKLAVRNLVRYRLNSSLLIAMFAGTCTLFTLGTSFLVSSASNLRSFFVDNVTGELAIRARTDIPVGVYGASTPSIGDLLAVPVIRQYPEVSDIIDAGDSVAAHTPLVTTVAALDFRGRRYETTLFGIDPQSYPQVFPGVQVVRGEWMQPGARQVMLSEQWAQRLSRETGEPVGIGDELLLSTVGRQGFRIRPVTVVGVFAYPVSLELTDQNILVDAATARELLAIFAPSSGDQEPGEETAAVSEPDDLFAAPPVQAEPDTEQRGIGVDEVLGLLASPQTHAPPEQGGTAHLVLLRLADSRSADRVMRALEQDLQAFAIEVISWREAAGNASLLAFLLQTSFTGGFILFLVAVIVASVNIVLIAVMRRTREFGTFRALGAQRLTVARMVWTELGLVGVISGVIGIALAVLIARWVSSLGIATENQLLGAVAGGSRIQIRVLPVVAGLSLIGSVLLSLLSSWLPVRSLLQRSPQTLLGVE